MRSLILCRYGELTLKGNNRVLFERCLTQNIKQMLYHANIPGKITRKRGRTFVEVDDEQQAAAIAVLQRVFGLTSVSSVLTAALDYPAIEAAIKQLLNEKSFTTFAVRAQRLQKVLDPTPQIQQKLGKFIAEQFGKKVDLTNPDLELSIEIIDQAYLFVDRFPAPGGLPAGIEGTIYAVIESDADMLAAWLAMKRGCTAIPVQRKLSPIDLLIAYGCTTKPIPINHLNDLDATKAEAIVVGDAVPDTHPSLPVLRPLVGYTGQQITKKIEELCTPLSRK